jgi:hypothetical protein
MEREIRAWLRGQADTREPIFKAALEAGLLDSSAVTLANSPVLRHYQRKAFTSIRDSIGRAVTAAKDSAADDVLRQGALALSAGEGRDAADRVIWRATGELAELGVTGDSGPSGRRISLEAFARREINTTLNNASRNMQWERAREWGSDLIIVSAHAGARPKCRPWQGKVYSLAPGNPDRMYIGDTSYGEPAGLFGINCRHFSMPFFEGLNTEYPEDFRDPEGVLRREDGSEVTDAEIYEAEQGQRYLERNVRKRRKEAARFAAAGEDDRAAGARALARAWEGRLAGHIRESNSRGVDLVRQRERERVWTGA